NRSAASIFVLLAALYAPTRLVQEANPDWRLVSWALALEVVGLTLLAIFFLLGMRWLRRLAFPVGYMLVAVPWPTLVEAPLIQMLTRSDANLTVELLGWFHVPALPHGNVIEIATGQVGINEACSGIRSFQATLMISLFLGELFRLNLKRRASLIVAGFGLSILFNVARMFVLVWVAAHHGMAAIATWHDPAGIAILLACFFCLSAIGIGLRSPGQPLRDKLPSFADANSRTQFIPLFVAFSVWILASEIAVETWYRMHEARMPAPQQWTIAWPSANPTFKEARLAEPTRQILRYDGGTSATWDENDLHWQAIYLRWNAGRTALHLAQNHTPAVCLTAAGHTLTGGSELEWIEAGDLRLPFAVYEMSDTSQPVFVFYCLWNDRANQQGFETMALNYGARLTPALQGLRNPGQRSLEIAITGIADINSARNAVSNALQGMVVLANGKQATALWK
ncbi:MAG: exosortase/archaeosortase family protein, partial [Verrucomicrobiota bacterium]